MIQLDISLLDRSFCDCFEAVLATVARWTGRDYEYMYINEWDFQFDLKTAAEQCCLGCALGYISDKRNALLQYHGIKYSEYSDSGFAGFLEILAQELPGGPVAVRTDTFYCPWDKSYMRNHNLRHILLITGVDMQKSTFYCTDPFYHIQNQSWFFEDFLKGYTGYYGLFTTEQDNSRDIDGIKILREHVASLLENQVFEKITLFAGELNKTEFFLNELKDMNTWETPLYDNIASYASSRKRIPDLVTFIANRTGRSDLLGCLDEMHIIGAEWDAIKDLILKLLNKGNDNNLKIRIVNRLGSVADAEKALAERLYNCL